MRPVAVAGGPTCALYRCQVHGGACVVVLKHADKPAVLVGLWTAADLNGPQARPGTLVEVEARESGKLAQQGLLSEDLEGVPPLSEADELAIWQCIEAPLGFADKPLPVDVFGFETSASSVLVSHALAHATGLRHFDQALRLVDAMGGARGALDARGVELLPRDTSQDQLGMWALLLVDAGQGFQDGAMDVLEHLARAMDEVVPLFPQGTAPDDEPHTAALWLMAQLDPVFLAHLQRCMDEELAHDNWEGGVPPLRYRMEDYLHNGVVAFSHEMWEWLNR